MSRNEKEYLNKAFDSNWIAPLGPHVDSFEKKISKYLGINSAAALSSGTAALHLALKLSGVKEGDIVLCSDFTFAASANVILYEKAIPVFLDCDINSWTVDLEVLEFSLKKYKPKAFIAVDLYGQSCNYEEIEFLCEKNNVVLIEDAAEALGSDYKNKKCGSFGKFGILSFNGNKIITTSGGGMLVSNNEDLINKARFLSTQAREKYIHYEHKELGYNYRMSNLLAAIGEGQLEVLDDRVNLKRKIFKNYFSALSKFEGIDFLNDNNFCRSNKWLTTLVMNPEIIKVNYKIIIDKLEKENIESRPLWKPMHMQPLYKNYDFISKKNIDVSKSLYRTGLCLPSGACLKKDQQNKIIDILMSIIK